MRAKEPLYRVVIADPLTRKEVRELGFFRESFAREFVEEYRRVTEGDPEEMLIALAFPAEPQARELAA